MPVSSSEACCGASIAQSRVPSTSPGKRSVATTRSSTPVDPITASALDALGLAAQQPQRADAVAADVHQRAAVELGVAADVRAVGEREAERRADGARLADGLAGEPAEGLDARVQAPHHALHQHAPGSLGGVERGLDVGRPARQRLLGERVLAGLEGADRPRDVERVGKRHVDRVDLRVVEQRLVGAVRTRDPVLGGKRLGTSEVARGDGDNLGALDGACGAHDRARRGGRREDAPAKGHAEIIAPRGGEAAGRGRQRSRARAGTNRSRSRRGGRVGGSWRFVGGAGRTGSSRRAPWSACAVAWRDSMNAMTCMASE